MYRSSMFIVIYLNIKLTQNIKRHVHLDQNSVRALSTTAASALSLVVAVWFL